MLEKNFKKCGNTRFALRDFLILLSEPMWNFILWALWSSRNPKNDASYFCAPKFISFQCPAKYFALRSTLLFMSVLPCFCAPELILSQECSANMFCGPEFTSSQKRSIKLFALWSSLHLRSASSKFLLSGQMMQCSDLKFCAPIYCNGCFISIVFPLMIQKNRLRIDFQNICNVC